jgi:hypothetical protein
VNTGEMRQVLVDHADGSKSPGRTRSQQVQGLLDLAEQLQGILVPVAPNANYRRRLHGDLILEAQRRELEPAASVVGVIIAFLLRHRRGGATRVAAG